MLDAEVLRFHNDFREAVSLNDMIRLHHEQCVLSEALLRHLIFLLR